MADDVIKDLIRLMNELKDMMSSYGKTMPVKVAFGSVDIPGRYAGKSYRVNFDKKTKFSDVPIIIPIAQKRVIVDVPKISIPSFTTLPAMPKIKKIDMKDIQKIIAPTLEKIDFKPGDMGKIEINAGYFSYIYNTATTMGYGTFLPEWNKLMKIKVYKYVYEWFTALEQAVLIDVYQAHKDSISMGDVYHVTARAVINGETVERKLKVKVVYRYNDPDLPSDFKLKDSNGNPISFNVYYEYDVGENLSKVNNMIRDIMFDKVIAPMVSFSVLQRYNIYKAIKARDCKNLPWWTFVSPLAWATYLGLWRSSWCNVSDDIRKLIADAWGRIAKMSATLGTDSLNYIYDAMTGHSLSIVSIVNGIDSMAKNMLDSINKIIDNLNNSFDDLTNNLNINFNEIKDMVDVLNSNIESWNAEIDKWRENFNSKMDEFRKSIETSVNSAIEQVFVNLGIVPKSNNEAWITVPVYITSKDTRGFNVAVPEIPTGTSPVPAPTQKYGYVYFVIYIDGQRSTQNDKVYVTIKGPQSYSGYVTNGQRIKLLKGKYNITARYNKSTVNSEFTVVGGKNTYVTLRFKSYIPEGKGVLVVKVYDVTNGKNEVKDKVHVTITRDGNKVYDGDVNSGHRFTLDPGKYKVTVTYKGSTSSEYVNVYDGKTTTVTFTFKSEQQPPSPTPPSPTPVKPTPKPAVSMIVGKTIETLDYENEIISYVDYEDVEKSENLANEIYMRLYYIAVGQ